MADPRPRRRRLLSLLPKIVAEQPENSAVGVLIGTMAGVLSEMDEATERVMRDHWVGLACGRINADDAMAILERLGPYLGLAKLDGETGEDYRLRLMRFDKVRVNPVGQIKSLLEDQWSGAMAALADEAVSRLRKELSSIADDDEEGIRLALLDHWTRLAGGDINLKNDATALDFTLPETRDAIPAMAAVVWKRVLSDHWAPILERHWTELGRDEDALAADHDALSRLGGLFGIRRLKQRVKKSLDEPQGHSEIHEVREEIEAYRRRIQLTASIMGRGLTSPQALLELTIVTLGAEFCSRTEIDRDALIARGVPLGVAKRCPVCRSGSKEPCPNQAQWLVEAWITDNPPRERQFTPPTPLRPGGKPFEIASSSLETAIPELNLKATEERTIAYPYLQNRNIGEIMLYAGEIGPGEVLKLYPQIAAEECDPFLSHEEADAYPWLRQYPAGLAVVIGADGLQRDVSEKICFLTGDRFPDDKVEADYPNAPTYAAMDATEGIRFADALNQGEAFDNENTQFDQSRFVSSSLRVRMPRLRPGKDLWEYGGYDYQNVKAVVGNNPGDLLANAPAQVEDVPAEVNLTWWVRPPALFRLTVPKNDWVIRADGRGAHDEIARLVQKARAAGVTALIDFPELPRREYHPVSDRFRLKIQFNWREHHVLDESQPHWQGISGYQETQPMAEGALLWRGVFDATRLDGSRFTDESGELPPWR